MARVFLLASLLLLFTYRAHSSLPQRQVLVTYPNETPDSVINGAMDAVRSAGGIVTHKFTLIKGFSAKVVETAFNTIGAFSTEYKPNIEEDQQVTTQTENNKQFDGI